MPEILDVLAGAAGGSRLLDAMVARATGLRADLVDGELTVFLPRGRRAICPGYTTSIDAALSALPEGWHWSFDAETGQAAIWRRWPNGQTEQFTGISRIPAIALCIVAIEARRRAARSLHAARR